MSSVRRSLALSFLESYLVIALQVVWTVVVSRLLTPEEIGVVAIASVLTTIASVIRDFGVAEYLIQERTVTDDKIRASLAANIAISWVLALALLAGRGLVGEFFRDARIENVLLVTSFNFFLIPIGAVPMAWYRRELNFNPVLLSGVTATLVSTIVGIGLLLWGVGYMSLAWASLSSVAASVAIALWYRPAGFPFLPGLREIKGVMRFGVLASAIYILRDIGRAAPELVVGRMLGVGQVGYYSRAGGLLELFSRFVSRAVMPVLLPYFSLVGREGAEPATGYTRALSFLTSVAWPFFAMAALMTYPLIRIMYGPQWDAAVPLARILAVGAALEVLALPAKEALVAVGRIRDGASLQSILVGMRVAGVLIAAPFGLEAVCWSIAVTSTLIAAVSVSWLHVRIGLRLAELGRVLRASMAVTVVSILPTVAVLLSIGAGPTTYVEAFALSALLTIPAWVIALKVFRHPAFDELCVIVARVRRFVTDRLSR